MPSDTVESLDGLAESMDRDRSDVLNEAVENYLLLNEHHSKLIKKGLRAAAEGKLVSHAEVKKMISKMGRSKLLRANAHPVEHTRHATMGRRARVHRGR
ncbi:MAG: hypothetical protein ABSH39_09495 [Candidatus Acidiferrum sp.]|jgi:predicted transcriptional regulator